ncbi:MAG: class I SAM-dependent methyltransferase [Nodosilinea sp.]
MYSLENAKKFNWSSVNGNLIPERVSHLKNYLVGTKILDAGCGGGAYVEYLSRQGMQVTGIDSHQEFLQIAQNNSTLGSYIEGDITSLPFSENSFETTFCFDVLEHVDDRKALKEIARVTSKRIILTVPHEDKNLQKFGLMLSTYQDPTHLRYYSLGLLEELCSSIKTSDFFIFPEGYLPCKSIVEYFMDNIQLEKQSGLHSHKSQKFMRRRLENLFRSIISKFLKRISYREVYMGLVAVLDLQ